MIADFTRHSMALMLLSFFCCVSYSGTQAQTGVEHSISEIQGQVEVRRAGWEKFVRATVNMRVRNGDLFRLTGKSSAKVTCADTNVIVIQGRNLRVDCKTTKPIFRFKNNVTRPQRTGDPIRAFPVLISPRKTKLLDPRPTLRWTPVSGASVYRVSIIRGTAEHWAREVSGVTELKYPEDAPALVPGETYKAIIAAGNHNSDEEELPNLGFTVLGRDEAHAVRMREGKIRAKNPSELSTIFLIANLYATWGVNPDDSWDDRWALNTEAIELLEQASATRPDASILRMLGDMYMSLSLATLAEKPYMRALELSEATEDVFGKAWAHYALAHVFTERFNDAETTKRLLSARKLFQSFGDAKSVEKINTDLAELNKRRKQ